MKHPALYAIPLMAMIIGSVMVAIHLAGNQSVQRAEAVLDFLAKEPVASLRQADFERQMNSLHLAIEKECSAEECILQSRITNWPLAMLRLAPETELYIRVVFQSGKGASSHIRYSTFDQLGPVNVVDDFNDARLKQFFFHPLLTESDLRYRVTFNRWSQGKIVNAARQSLVHLSPKSTSEERRRAYELNLHCLVQVGGCSSSVEMAPSIWNEEPQRER